MTPSGPELTVVLPVYNEEAILETETEDGVDTPEVT